MPDRKPQALETRIAICIEAMKSERLLRFGYIDREGVQTWRIVEPIKIHGLHLCGWCLHRTEYRKFHLMRTLDLRVGPHPHEVLLPLPDLQVEAADDGTWFEPELE